MAPPPASGTVSQRLLALAQTLQFGWFVGHLTLLISTLRYGLSYITFNWNSNWAAFSYRTAFVAAAATYGIVVFKAFRAHARAQSSPLALAGDENVQYLAMALVWLFARQVPLAVLPFTVYSVFHVASYTRQNILPILQPATPPPAGTSPSARPPTKSSPFSDSIKSFVSSYYKPSMKLVAILEIALWLRVFFSALTFTKGSWILLFIYSAFLRARFSQSEHVEGMFRHLTARVDSALANQNTPPAARQGWEAVKGGLGQFAEITDLKKYISGAPTQPKKAQ